MRAECGFVVSVKDVIGADPNRSSAMFATSYAVKGSSFAREKRRLIAQAPHELQFLKWTRELFDVGEERRFARVVDALVEVALLDALGVVPDPFYLRLDSGEFSVFTPFSLRGAVAFGFGILAVLVEVLLGAVDGIRGGIFAV